MDRVSPNLETASMSNTSSNPLAMFGKYGLPGLVIAALLYFVWFNMNKVSVVVEKNTEVFTEVKGTLSQMKDALRDNTAAIQKLREDRAADRRRTR